MTEDFAIPRVPASDRQPSHLPPRLKETPAAKKRPAKENIHDSSVDGDTVTLSPQAQKFLQDHEDSDN